MFKLSKKMYLSIFVMIGMLSLSVVFSLSMKKHATTLTHQIFRERSLDIQKEIEYLLDSEVSFLSEIAEYTASYKQITAADWRTTISLFFQKRPELRKIEWITSDLKVKNAIFKENPSESEGESSPIVNQLKDLLADVEKHKSPYLFFDYKHEVSSHNLIILCPMYEDQVFQGFILGAVDFSLFLNGIFGYQASPSFSLEVFSEGNKVASLNETEVKQDLEWQENIDIYVKNLKMQVSYYPALSFIRQEVSVWIDIFPLVGGFLLAVCLGRLVYLWQLNRDRLAASEATGRDLLAKSVILHAANVGTWNWDVEKNQIVLDESTYAFLGISQGEFKGKYQDLVSLVFPEDKEKFEKMMRACFETGVFP